MVDHANHDKKFVVTFLAVLGILVGIAFVIAIAASIINGASEPEGVSPALVARIEERIKPVATVVTDPAVLAMKAAAAPAREPMTGEQVVGKICAACHQTGLMESPKIGDAAAWQTRLDAQGGVDGIVATAIEGLNQMPARGGDPSLSDEELHAAVEYMLQQSGL